MKTFLITVSIVVLAFFAIVSFFSLSSSFASYRSAKGHAEHVLLDRSYVEQQLRDVQENSMRHRYDNEQIGIVEMTSLNRIDLRGTELTPGGHRPFSPQGVEFTVLEQDDS